MRLRGGRQDRKRKVTEEGEKERLSIYSYDPMGGRWGGAHS